MQEEKEMKGKVDGIETYRVIGVDTKRECRERGVEIKNKYSNPPPTFENILTL